MNRYLNRIKDLFQSRINDNNRKNLINRDVTIIASNCTGGFLYHWLGLQFRSPFINLYMTPQDFITALSNFDAFMDQDIIEVKDSGRDYPVGLGYGNTLIHFMHYPDFSTAIKNGMKENPE